jgi:hypothetical protein
MSVTTNGPTTAAGPPDNPRDPIADAVRALWRGTTTAAGAMNRHARRAAAVIGQATSDAARSVGAVAGNAVRVATDRPGRAWWARLAILPFFFFVCVNFNAEGVRNSIEFAATPLYKLPLLSGLGDFEETRRLDVAIITALGIMVVVWFLFERLVGIYLRAPAVMTNEEKLTYYVGIPMLVADSWMFMKGVYNGGLFGGDDFFTAALLTVLYAGSIIVCAWGVHLIRHGSVTKEMS